MQINLKNRLVAHGLAVGLETLTNLKFKPDKPYTYCRICGAIFQNENSRTASTVLKEALAKEERRVWSLNHAKTHTLQEHTTLVVSGLWLMPEAANKLAAFGVIPLADSVINEESNNALRESSPIPFNDSEC